MSPAGAPTEAQRQQALLRALWGDESASAVTAGLRDPAARAARGLQVYRANAGALAERALAAAYPTIAQLVGDPSFGALARALRHAELPRRGDLAMWGAALPGFIAVAPQLAEEAYLADVARLDWAVHVAEQAGDAAAAATGLKSLATIEPAALWLRLTPGTALVASPHPVATIWHAHRRSDAERFKAVREAFLLGAGEHALVWRAGFKAQVTALPEAVACFTRAVLDGHTLEHALDRAGDGFSFERWLLAALKHGWIAAVDTGSAGMATNGA